MHIVKVKTQTKHYANDKDASKNLIATDKDIMDYVTEKEIDEAKIIITENYV